MGASRQARAGCLVVIEGIDGAGKSTLQRGIAQSLEARGYRVVQTKEPTDGPIGQKIRALAKTGRDEVSPEQEFALFHDDRRQHVDTVVRPALERGDIVVQDRSYFSSVAYQGERGLDKAKLLQQSEAIAPRPDVLLVVDLPAEVALERIAKSRSGRDDFERLESLQRIRNTFLEFAGAVIVDGTDAAEDVLARALRAIEPMLPPAPPSA